jgi:hypothetical protein
MTAASLDRQQLAKVLGLLGSRFDGEVVAAARMAERLRAEAGVSWAQIVVPALPTPAQRHVRSYTVAQAVQFLLDRWDLLTDWEIAFAERIQRQRKPLSGKQREVLDRLVAKCRVEAAA